MAPKAVYLVLIFLVVMTPALGLHLAFRAGKLGTVPPVISHLNCSSVTSSNRQGNVEGLGPPSLGVTTPFSQPANSGGLVWPLAEKSRSPSPSESIKRIARGDPPPQLCGATNAHLKLSWWSSCQTLNPPEVPSYTDRCVAVAHDLEHDVGGVLGISSDTGVAVLVTHRKALLFWAGTVSPGTRTVAPRPASEYSLRVRILQPHLHRTRQSFDHCEYSGDERSTYSQDTAQYQVN